MTKFFWHTLSITFSIILAFAPAKAEEDKSDKKEKAKLFAKHSAELQLTHRQITCCFSKAI